MASRERKRHGHVDLPAEWIQSCNEWYRAQRPHVSLVTLAKRLSETAGIQWGKTTVWNYLQGSPTTAEMTEAFATLMGVVSPLARHDDPALERWCNLGQRFQRLAPAAFAEEAENVERIVLAFEARIRRS